MITSVRVLLVSGVLGFAGCAFTMTYDDFDDQQTNVGTGGGDAGCVPVSCESLSADCGDVPDGCGKNLDCGQCPSGQTCGAAGENRCGTGTCTPQTCEQKGAFCGDISDGCGNTISCGQCQAPKTCGAQKPNECGCATLVSCTSENCGLISDGCGGQTDCGPCPGGFVCVGDNATDPGGGQTGTQSHCAQCYQTCEQAGANCGQLQLCTGLTNCGQCPDTQSCGGGGFGTPNQCG
jgi:hypothetical protein